MKTTVTFPETARICRKTLILRLGEIVLAGAMLAALLIFVVSVSAARETSADASNPVPDGGRQATAMAVDPPCGMPDGISIDHMESAGGWHFSSSDLTVTVTPTIVSGLNGQALQLDYNLGTAKGAWVQMRRDYSSGLDISGGDHLRFYYRGTITNTLEVGLTSGEPQNYFASSWNSVTQVPWWTYATWDYRDFLLGDHQPFPDFSDVRAIYISVANKDGDVGGVGSLIIDELQYVSVAARTVPSDFEPVTVPPTVTQKAADWIAARQQPSGLLKSWQEEYQDYAWLYDQALGLIVLSETDLSKAGKLTDTLHTRQNADGSWYNGYHFTTLEPADLGKPVGANAWMVYALMRYYWRSGNQTALQDALEGAGWLAALQRPDGSLPGEVSGTGAGTEPNLSAWWAFRAAGYSAQADRLKTYLTEQAWDGSTGRFNSSGANYPPRGRYEILLDNQTWGAAFLHAIGRDEDARRALSYARWTLLVDPPRRDMCGFGGSGPLSVWNEGTLQYVAAHGENSQYNVDQMIAQQAADGGLPGSPDDFAGFAGYKEWLTRMHGVVPTAWLYFAGTGGPFSPTPEEKIRMEADYILACQYTGPGPAYGAINNVYGPPTYVKPGEIGMAILGLDLATQWLDDPVYRARAQDAANYLVRVQQTDGAWCDQYNYENCSQENDGRAKSPRHTAEVMMALHRLGYDHNRYAAMKLGAGYLLACQDPANNGNNDDGLLGGGKDANGQWRTWRWTHDNAYAYWALKAVQHWAAIEGDVTFRNQVAASARRILQGIDQFLQDPASPVWYIAVDEHHVPVKNPHLPCLPSAAPAYPSWIQYAPQMLDLPVLGVNAPAVGEWIDQTFSPVDGSCAGCLGYTCDDDYPPEKFRLRKYPGFALQSTLSWFDTGHPDYANAAVAWAETSGLWQTTPDPVNHVTGGFVDWIEVTPTPSLTPEVWKRYIDTSAYAVGSWNNGYDFRIQDFRIQGLDLDRHAADWAVYTEGTPTWIKENVATPALDTESLRCAITGGQPYSNIHCYRNLTSEPAATTFTLNLFFRFSPPTTFNNQGAPSIVQALEFSMSKWYQAQRYEWAVQWQNVGSGAPQWRLWNPHAAEPWASLGIPATFAGDQWHSLILEGEIHQGMVRYQTLIVDGQSHALNVDVAPVAAPGEADRLAVAFQLDGNSVESPYDMFVDKVILATGADGIATPTPTLTPSATATRTPASTPTPTGTPTATRSATATATPSATSTQTVTATATASRTPTPTGTPTATRTATATATPSATSTQTVTRTATATPTPTATSTQTVTFTATATPTPTATPTGNPQFRNYLPYIKTERP